MTEEESVERATGRDVDNGDTFGFRCWCVRNHLIVTSSTTHGVLDSRKNDSALTFIEGDRKHYLDGAIVQTMKKARKESRVFVRSVVISRLQTHRSTRPRCTSWRSPHTFVPVSNVNSNPPPNPIPPVAGLQLRTSSPPPLLVQDHSAEVSSLTS